MKRLFGILLVAALGTSASAVTKNKQFEIYDFHKGLDSYQAPSAIPDGYVQNSLNVLFDDIAPATKRSGYTVAWSTKAYQFTGLWTYTDPTNTTWQIARSSDQITATNFSGTVVEIATVSVNNLVGETNGFGYAFFTDQTQGIYYWNGSSTTYETAYPQAPLGSIITQFHGRIAVTGAAVPNQNELYLSTYYDAISTNAWNTAQPGFPVTEAAFYPIGLQDNFDNTTAEYVYLDTLYLFKHSSIFALYGFDQSSFQTSQLTQECGCIDGGSIQTYNSALEFVSLRGVESFNGYSCTRISDLIKNKIDPAIQVGGFSQASWVQSSLADWAAGTIVNLDTTTFAPAIALTNPILGINNPSFESGFSNWTPQSEWSNVASNIGIFCTVTPKDGSLMAMATLPNVSGCGSACNTLVVSVVYSSNTSSVISSGTFANVSACDAQTWTQYSLPTNIPTNTPVTLTFQTQRDSSTLTQNFNTDGSSITFWINLDFGNGVANSYIYLDFLGGQPYGNVTNSSGTFISQIHNVGSITSWGNFPVVDSLNNGTIGFSICSSTNSNMSAPESCSTQTPNAQITIATGTYVQWSATFTVTFATQTPTLQSGTVQWFTGNKAVPLASTVWDNRYWLSLTTTTADSSNDAVMVLNHTGGWSIFDIHAGAFTQYKNQLYHADSNPTGNIYLDNQGFADNGNAINAFLTTKNEGLGDLGSDDYLYAVYPSASSTGNCAMSLSYTMDINSQSYQLGSPLLSEFNSFTSVRLPFPIDSSHQDFGQSVSFTVGTDDSQCAWQFIGLEGLYKQRPLQ